MNIGYRLYEGAEDFEQLQLEMALACESNGWCMEDGYDAEGRRYLIINPPYEEPTPTLDEVKAARWKAIRQDRDNAEQAGCPYMDSVLDSDSLSVQRINTAVQAAQVIGESFAVDWTMQDNSVIHMTYADVLGMPAALAAFSNELHTKARGLRERIEAAETVEEVNAIVW